MSKKQPKPQMTEREAKVRAIYKQVDFDPDDWFTTYRKRIREEVGPHRYVQWDWKENGTAIQEEFLPMLLKLGVESVPDPSCEGSDTYAYFFFSEVFADDDQD